MCFRPSALAGNEPQVQMGECPHCHQPVAASIGILSGDCPHCGKPITQDAGGNTGGNELGVDPLSINTFF